MSNSLDSQVGENKENPIVFLNDYNSVHQLSGVFNGNNDELKFETLKSLIDLLPHQAVINNTAAFPDHHLAAILKLLICSKTITSKCKLSIQELLIYPDISKNIWKALDIACKECTKFGLEQVKNVIELINLTEKPSVKENEEIGPKQYLCLTQVGVLEEKDIGPFVKRIWNKLVSVDLPPKLMQSLLLTLHERLMPRMKRPIFLIDFFMTTLEYGGSICILALQGILNLYKDENMNYPNVYKKLYSMVTSEMFDAQYKARFYYLTDIFLSSSHLPQALVASFIKKFARLSLFAPPSDAIILLTCIMNLLIRHPGLKRLSHNPNAVTLKTDPYRAEETDPAVTAAVYSSLWEVELLESHAVPAVANVASFIRRPLPSTETDLSTVLENTTHEMFVKELKKKMKVPPMCFEKPSTLFVINDNVSHLWNLSS